MGRDVRVVGHLVRLKLTLLRNGLRRSVWQVVGLVIGGVYGLGALALVAFGLVGLATVGSLDLQRTVLVIAGSLLVAGWAVLPLIAFGVDATLDPARFVTFPIPRRSLLAGLGLAGLVGIPGVLTVLTVLASTLVWWRSPVAVVAALVAGALAVTVAVVASRAVTTSAARVLSGRRSREVSGFVVLGAMAVGYLLFGRLVTGSMSGDRLLDLLDGAVQVLGWTPLGAAWQVPADVTVGAWGTATARLAMLAGTVVVLVWWWDRGLAHALVQPPGRVASTAGAGHGLGWFARLPDHPAWAVAARGLTYWRRDPRYATAVVAVPLMPLALWAFGVGDGVVLVLPLLALVMGWSLSTDTSSDGTALWLHVASPLRGLDDRVGRAAAGLAVLGPIAVLITVALAAVSGRSAQLPALLGATLGTFLTAVGAASVMSALVVMRVQQAGENPFATRQGASLAAVGSQIGGFAAVGALALPEVVLGGLSLLWGSPVLGWVALLVGLVLGGLLLVVGVRWGGHLMDRRGPLLLQRLVTMS